MTGPSVRDEGLPPPCPATFNMAAHVLAPAARVPEKVALIVIADADGSVAESWTFGALDRAIRATAAGLRGLGLAPGERVLLRIGNSSDFPILFFATIAAGGVAVPTSAQLTPREIAALQTRVAPRFLAIDDPLSDGIEPGAAGLLRPAAWREMRGEATGPIAATGADDPAFLIFTSGTSGTPRGVLHAQRSAWARRMMWDGWYGLTPDDRVLHAGAFNWTYTLGAGLTDPWAAGATALVHAGPREADLWPRLAKAHAATIFAAVPGVYRQILRTDRNLREDLASLRHGLTAGERLPAATAEEWRARTGLALHEALGMSEVSTYVSGSPARPARPGTAGRPQPGRRVAVLGEDDEDGPVPMGTPGLLAVSRRDPGLMLGYWRDPEGTEAAFRGEWFLTGDRAVMDADGSITHLGRADEVMNALGYRVSPAEVEEALLPHPAIAEVAVAELPIRADLSLVAAFVVPRGDWPGEAALDAHAAGRLAAYKRPKLWIAVESLPRTANGKLIRRDLVQRHRRDG